MLSELQNLYERNLFESVIPFWLRHSIDREHGGFFTCLDRTGAIYDTRKYVWLNGRQVWTFAKLYNTIERRPEWLDAARSGAEFLRGHVFDEQGRCYFSLTREGQPSFYQRKPYGAGFVALGFWEFARASGEDWYRSKALELYARIAEWIANPSLLGRSPLAGGTAMSNLADIYILASLALEIGDSAMLAKCLQDIRLHVDPGTGLLHETATLDPGLRKSSPDARLICPGSIFEIYWILGRALRLCPDAEAEALLLRALDAACELAWDTQFGGYYYFMDIDGRPMLQLESDMKLWWVHCEGIYALLCAHLQTNDSKWKTRLRQAHDWTWSRFPDAASGEWFGYLHRDGSLSHSLKGNNYKGCFHVPRMLLYSVLDLRRANQH
ncbi:MAG: AGE family epimerase/isomerase [Acidobacteria bacterium]|nr:AGE family epimerase/isomerase [Acidobacteriota bacterium]